MENQGLGDDLPQQLQEILEALQGLTHVNNLAFTYKADVDELQDISSFFKDLPASLLTS